MERLTYRQPGIVDLKRKFDIDDALDRLAEYEDAEESGLLIRLPCNIGDTVYRVTKSGTILEECVDDIVMPEFYTKTQDGLRGHVAMWGEFGKTVFLDRAEAAFAKEG